MAHHRPRGRGAVAEIPGVLRRPARGGGGVEGDRLPEVGGGRRIGEAGAQGASPRDRHRLEPHRAAAGRVGGRHRLGPRIGPGHQHLRPGGRAGNGAAAGAPRPAVGARRAPRGRGREGIGRAGEPGIRSGHVDRRAPAAGRAGALVPVEERQRRAIEDVPHEFARTRGHQVEARGPAPVVPSPVVERRDVLRRRGIAHVEQPLVLGAAHAAVVRPQIEERRAVAAGEVEIVRALAVVDARGERRSQPGAGGARDAAHVVDREVVRAPVHRPRGEVVGGPLLPQGDPVDWPVVEGQEPALRARRIRQVPDLHAPRGAAAGRHERVHAVDEAREPGADLPLVDPGTLHGRAVVGHVLRAPVVELGLRHVIGEQAGAPRRQEGVTPPGERRGVDLIPLLAVILVDELGAGLVRQVDDGDADP